MLVNNAAPLSPTSSGPSIDLGAPHPPLVLKTSLRMGFPAQKLTSYCLRCIKQGYITSHRSRRLHEVGRHLYVRSRFQRSDRTRLKTTAVFLAPCLARCFPPPSHAQVACAEICFYSVTNHQTLGTNARCHSHALKHSVYKFVDFSWALIPTCTGGAKLCWYICHTPCDRDLPGRTDRCWR